MGGGGVSKATPRWKCILIARLRTPFCFLVACLFEKSGVFPVNTLRFSSPLGLFSLLNVCMDIRISKKKSKSKKANGETFVYQAKLPLRTWITIKTEKSDKRPLNDLRVD